MTPDGKRPTPYKRYYDVFTWLVTQLAFTFTTTPFILLSLHDSLLAWSRVYFYAIIGVGISSLFLLTPGKTFLQKKVKARTTVPAQPSPGKPEVHRADSQEALQGATLGVPHEPGQEFDEMVDEITEEVKKRKGSAVGPDGAALRKLVADTLDRNLEGLRGANSKAKEL